jgi:ABC-type amino acid transport system permease subunit
MLAFPGTIPIISVHRNARMTEMERSGIEVILAFADNVARDHPRPGMHAFQVTIPFISVHRNARMTEITRSGIEVILAFADNVASERPGTQG